MRNIVISLQNILLTEAVVKTLDGTGEFHCERVLPEKARDIPIICQAARADLLLMEVGCGAELNLSKRMETVAEVRFSTPECKEILLCDENAYPELAHQVMRARQDRRIDGFFYASVTADYLIAALESM